jgi:hypothetical protein
MSLHEFVTSLREHFHSSLPQRTEQLIEIRNRLLHLVDHPAEPSQVETASEPQETRRLGVTTKQPYPTHVYFLSLQNHD